MKNKLQPGEVTQGEVSVKKALSGRTGVFIEGVGFVAWVPQFSNRGIAQEMLANAEAMAKGLALAQQGVKLEALETAQANYQAMREVLLDVLTSLHAENWHKAEGHKAEAYELLRKVL